MGRDADVLDFWRLHQAELPNLARIARIVLAIPASSSKSERVFRRRGGVWKIVLSRRQLSMISLSVRPIKHADLSSEKIIFPSQEVSNLTLTH